MLFFDKFGLPVADVQSMKDAVDAAYRMAKKGETVLLSPCCASFDLFKVTKTVASSSRNV